MDKEFSGYQSAITANALPLSTSSVPDQYKTSSWEKGSSGFEDIKEVCPNVHPNYDAMSSKWLGDITPDKTNPKNIVKSQSAPAPAST